MRLDGTYLWVIGVSVGGWASNTRNVAYGVLTDKGVITVFKVSHTNFVRVLSLGVLMLETVIIP